MIINKFTEQIIYLGEEEDCNHLCQLGKPNNFLPLAKVPIQSIFFIIYQKNNYKCVAIGRTNIFVALYGRHLLPLSSTTKYGHNRIYSNF